MWQRNKLDCPLTPYDFFTNIIKTLQMFVLRRQTVQTASFTGKLMYMIKMHYSYSKFIIGISIWSIRKLWLEMSCTNAKGKTNKHTCGCSFNQSCDGTPWYCTYKTCKTRSSCFWNAQPVDTDVILTYMIKNIHPKMYCFKTCYFKESDYQNPVQKLVE